MRYLLYYYNDIVGADNDLLTLADTIESCCGVVLNRQKLIDDISNTGRFACVFRSWRIESVNHTNSRVMRILTRGGIRSTILRNILNQ